MWFGFHLLLPFVVTDSVTATACTILIPAQAVVFVYARLVVIGMAARAVRSISGRPVVNRLRVSGVAFCTVKVATVIERLVCQRGVTVVRRCPGIGNVTGIALLRCVEVTRVRAACYDTIVAA